MGRPVAGLMGLGGGGGGGADDIEVVVGRG